VILARGSIYKFFIVLSLLIVSNSISYADTLKQTVTKTIQSNPSITASISKYESSNKDVQIARDGYKPTVDLSAFLGAKKQKDSTRNSTNKGIDATLKLNQPIYDGGFIAGNIDVAKSEQESLFLAYKLTKEKKVLEAVNTYLDLYKNSLIKELTNKNYSSHKKIMKIAKDNEKISGEVIDRLETQTRVKLLEIEISDNKILIDKLKQQYNKTVGEKPKISKMCKPPLQSKYIPKSIEDAISIALMNNPKYLSSLQQIKTTRSKIKLENSKFYPKVKFSADTNYDKNYQLKDDTSTQTSAKINLDYNIYNGSKDIHAREKSKLLYAEAFELSQESKDEIISSIKEHYNKLKDSKKSLFKSKEYLDITLQLVETNEQKFQMGTKTIMDLLNSRDKYNRAKEKVLNLEFDRLKSYYALLDSMGILSDTILSSTKECDKRVSYYRSSRQKARTKNQTPKIINIDSELNKLKNFFNSPKRKSNSKKYKRKKRKKSNNSNLKVDDEDFDLLKAINDNSKNSYKISTPSDEESLYLDKQKLKENMLKDILNQAYGVTKNDGKSYFKKFDNIEKSTKKEKRREFKPIKKIKKPTNKNQIKSNQYEGFGFDEIDKLLNDDFEQSYLKKKALKNKKIITPSKDVPHVRTIKEKKIKKSKAKKKIYDKKKNSKNIKRKKLNRYKNRPKSKKRKISYNQPKKKKFNKYDKIKVENASQNDRFVLINDDFETKYKARNNRNAYTLLLGSFSKYKDAAEFTIWNKLDENSIIVKKRKKRYVLYGVYRSYNSAKRSIKKLKSSIQRMKPKVVKIKDWK
jgi:adhesin transport system outer membrane protein